MKNPNESISAEAARSVRGRPFGLLFLAAWTVFACFVVWWLPLHRDSTLIPDLTPTGDSLPQSSLADRMGNWFKLLDVAFHGIYPFILLAPYVVWLAARFHLEEGRWRVSLPIILSGCALFVIASSVLAGYIGPGRRISIMVRSQAFITTNGQPRIIATGETNLARDFPNVLLPWKPPVASGQAVRVAVLTNFPAGFAGVTARWSEPGEPGPLDLFVRSDWTSQLLSCLLNVFGCVGIVGLVNAVHFYNRSREREHRTAALEARLAKARLSALQAQLHPHFLFNALNAISTLLRRDTRAAQDALASFSELLRLALSHSSQPEVSLREDVEFLKRYVEIQQTRLGERLRFEDRIDPAAFDCFVPALLLQPLVENAIRHGIEPSPDPGVVRVAVHPSANRLFVSVEDNGAGLPVKEADRKGAGIGLQNLRSRMEALYGDQQRVEVTTREGGGVRVNIEIPLRTARAGEAVAAARA